LLEGRKEKEEVERKKGDHPFLFRPFFPRAVLFMARSRNLVNFTLFILILFFLTKKGKEFHMKRKPIQLPLQQNYSRILLRVDDLLQIKN
jgi:hypothetical protein